MWEFILNHLVLIICLLAIIVSFVVILVVLIKMKRTKKVIEEDNSLIEQYVEAFGGLSNIKSCVSRDSRLSLELVDYDKIDNDKLKSLNITSFHRMTNKITYVIGQTSQEIEKYINDHKLN